MGRAKGMTSAGLSGFDQVMGTRRGSKRSILVASYMTPQADKVLAPHFRKIESGKYNEVLDFIHKHGEDYEHSAPLKQLFDELSYYIAYRRHHDLLRAGRFHLSAWGLGASSPIHIVQANKQLHITADGMSVGGKAKTVCGHEGHVNPVLAGDWKTAPKEYRDGEQFYNQFEDKYSTSPGRATRCSKCEPYAEMYPECEDYNDYERRWKAAQVTREMAVLAQSSLSEALFTMDNGFLQTKEFPPRMANIEEGLNEELDTEFTTSAGVRMKAMGVASIKPFIGDKHFIYYRKELMQKHGISSAAAERKMVEAISKQQLPKQLYYDIRKSGIDTCANGDSKKMLDRLRQQARQSLEYAISDRAAHMPVVFDI